MPGVQNNISTRLLYASSFTLISNCGSLSGTKVIQHLPPNMLIYVTHGTLDTVYDRTYSRLLPTPRSYD